MNDREREDDEQTIGHSSTTAPGGEKEMTGDPGRTPGKAEGSEKDVEESLRRQESQGKS